MSTENWGYGDATPQPRMLDDVHESFRRDYDGRMSTKHIRTAADLVRFGASLKIDCVNCGASRTMERCRGRSCLRERQPGRCFGATEMPALQPKGTALDDPAASLTRLRLRG